MFCNCRRELNCLSLRQDSFNFNLKFNATSVRAQLSVRGGGRRQVAGRNPRQIMGKKSD